MLFHRASMNQLLKSRELSLEEEGRKSFAILF